MNGGEEKPFSSEFSIWIPDEDEPVFYLVTYDLELCDFLEINLSGFSYVLETISNPDGYWFEITVSPSAFQSILDGADIKGKFKVLSAKNEDCFTQHFTADLNSEVYEFGNGFLEFDDNFDMSADFFPTPCIKIFSKNRHLCEYLHLDLENYAYTLEELPEPHYLVTLPFDDLVPLVNGEALFGRFEYQHKVHVAMVGPKVE